MKNIVLATLVLFLGITCTPLADDASPKNVIIMIGDGMGFNHVDAGSLYRFGKSKGQTYWKLTPLAVRTHSLNNPGGYNAELAHEDFDYVKKSPTDSAAAATALSTAHKTHDGIIGQLRDGTKLQHIMDDAEALGKATGVLTTVFFAHATPAGFVAHNEARGNYEQIAFEMIWESPVDLIIGAGHPWYDEDGNQVGGFAPDIFNTKKDYKRVGGKDSWENLLEGKPAADANGDGTPDTWNLVTSREGIRNIASEKNPGRVLGVLPIFSTLQADRSGKEFAKPYQVPMIESSPTMTELMAAALNALNQDKDGFVLMAEGGAIDWVSHGNQSGRLIEEQLDFDRAVEYTIAWIEKNSNWDETLLIVTSDHETGYLTGPGSDPTMQPLIGRGAGVQPAMEWHSGSHTNQLVPLFMKGPGTPHISDQVLGVDKKHGPYIDNTAIPQSIRTLWAKNLPVKVSFLVKPYLQQARKDGITVMFESTLPTTATVRYGEATPNAEKANLSQQVESSTMQPLHEITLHNLKPETNYFYQVVATDTSGSVIESEVLSFKTNVNDNSAYAFAVFSDSQTNPTVWGTIAELAWRERPNFAIHAGDIVGTGRIKEQWVDHFLNPGHVFLGRIPTYFILGNHEGNADNFYKYISNPDPEYYFSFTYGNADFFMLDSCRDLKPGSEIYNWLDSALARSTAQWKFVVHHHPPYTSDEDDYGDTYKELSLLGAPVVQPLIPLYDKHQVDMVFYGHIHDYERTWPIRNNQINHSDGVVYIQTGGCGGGLENYAPTRSWFTQKLHRDHHFCLVNIHENNLHFQAIDQNWQLFDTFSIKK
jgi:alkaline phosphatase/predicted phosphodiesterase